MTGSTKKQNIIVSIISDHTIPNLRFIKEFTNISEYIFITTEEMRKNRKTLNLINALNIPQRKTKQITVPSFDMERIEHILLSNDFDDSKNYLVNITGGTKPMSITVLTFFSAFKNVRIFYVPIGEGTYRQVYPRISAAQKKFTSKITLREYLDSYGLEILSMEQTLKKEFKVAERIFNKMKLLGNLNKLEEITTAHNRNNATDRTYFSGGWFEEYIYYKFKQIFDLKQNEIAFNVNLKNNKSKNEYDVIFVHNDSIYIVECKAYYGKSDARAKIEKGLYKLGALDEDFGLKAKPVYITTYDFTENNRHQYKSLSERAKALNVQLFHYRDLINENYLYKIK
jgi:hypothetical protein